MVVRDKSEGSRALVPSSASEELPRQALRRRQIVQAAYLVIAERGFEGLRMREVAKRAGLDHATLHYYFASKKALVDAVFDYIVWGLSLGRQLSADTKLVSPRQRLAAHFTEIQRQMKEQPEMFVVLTEIHARALRDPRVRSIVKKNNRGWRAFLMHILREGAERKEFHLPLGPEVAAETIMSLVRGVNLTGSAREGESEAPFRQLLLWLEGQ